MAQVIQPYRFTASQALEHLRDGTLTVSAYAESLLQHIEKRNPTVKAWAFLDPEYIRAQARALDQVSLEDRGPLHGLPIAVKDVIMTQDMPTGYNSPIYANQAPIRKDAACVMALRASGALIFGKTTTIEFASYGPLPPTTNPHEPDRSPGPSSTGSAAAVADFQIPIALGSQTGTSTTMPASFCGVYGFKPTWNAVSREGLAQASLTLDTLGLFTRSARDLQLLAEIFKIEDDMPVPEAPFQLKGARIGFVTAPEWPVPGRGTIEALQTAKQILDRHGAEVIDFELPEEFATQNWVKTVMSGEYRTAFLGACLFDRNKLDPHLRDFVEHKTGTNRKAQLEAYDGLARLRPIWDQIASEYDVVIALSANDEAKPREVRHVTKEGEINLDFLGIWSGLQAPAVSVPGFGGEHNLPVGLTLVAPRYHDMHLLHAASTIGHVFEAEGGWKTKL